MIWRCNLFHFFFGNNRFACFSVSWTLLPEDKPHRYIKRCTCVSTGNAGTPNAWDITTDAVLWPTPGKDSKSEKNNTSQEVPTASNETNRAQEAEANTLSQTSAKLELDSTHAYEDDSVLQSDLKTIKQSAVKMSVGQKQGASQIVKDWLDDGTESDQDNEDNDKNDKNEE